MFDSPSYSYRILAMAGPRTTANEHALLLAAAVRMFNRALTSGWLEQVKASLLGRANQLVDLNEAQLPVAGRHSAGVASVRLDDICGTLGRAGDFDRHFHPRSERLRERWQSVAVARLQGTALPAVALIQIGPRYCVLDGHHRISVARAFKQIEIDADITQWELSEPSVWEQVAVKPAPAPRLTQLTHSRST